MINIIGCYIRLSQADNKNDESDSVVNQRMLIHNYINAHSELHVAQILDFVDDGYTGTNTDRPAFQRMIQMAQCGQIQCIIVKDFSRFARNYISMGDYVEQIFPMLGIRFISINDNYDSADAQNMSDSLSLALKSVLNTFYSRELSKKMTAYFSQKMESGEHIGNPCFGYTKNKEGTKFIPDPEAAGIVRMIFDLALAGKSRTEIADILNEQGVPTPALYKQKNGSAMNCLTTPYPIWDHVKVSTILRQEAYTGRLVMRKRVKIAPCSKRKRKTDSLEQIVRENAHMAIVTTEEFDRVQELIPKQKGWDRRHQRQYPLKGLVRCGNCVRCMTLKKNSAGGYFVCPDHYNKSSLCPPQRYPMHDIEQALLCTIQQYLKLSAADFTRQKAQAPTIPSDRYQAILREKDDLLIRKRQCYEDYVADNLTLEEYRKQKDAYTKRGQELDQEIADCEKCLELPALPISAEFKLQNYPFMTWLDTKELNREMAICFVDSIYLHEDHMKINWKYRDLFGAFLNEGESI